MINDLDIALERSESPPRHHRCGQLDGVAKLEVRAHFRMSGMGRTVRSPAYRGLAASPRETWESEVSQVARHAPHVSCSAWLDSRRSPRDDHPDP